MQFPAVKREAVKAAFRRHFFLGGALVLLALMAVAGSVKVALSAVMPGSEAASGGRTAFVSAAVATPRAFKDQIDALGSAKGRQSVSITSNQTELITRVRMRDGATVHAGDILVDLKAQEQQADVSQSQAALDVARSNYDRYNHLAQAGFLAPSAMDQYRSAYREAQANLAAARSRQSDRVVRAPFSGRIGLTDIAPGALINPGAVIATLDDVSVMRVDFDVPDRYLPALRVGAPIMARPDPYPDRTVSGRILLIDSRIDPTTHAIRARAEFPNPDGLLVPGMLMHVAIQTGERQALALPEAAVQADGDQSYVYVLTRRGDATIAVQTPVEVGLNDSGFVEITSGLSAGARVVGDGLDRISPNAPVRLAGAGAHRPSGAQHS